MKIYTVIILAFLFVAASCNSLVNEYNTINCMDSVNADINVYEFSKLILSFEDSLLNSKYLENKQKEGYSKFFNSDIRYDSAFLARNNVLINIISKPSTLSSLQNCIKSNQHKKDKEKKVISKISIFLDLIIKQGGYSDDDINNFITNLDDGDFDNLTLRTFFLCLIAENIP
jgi:hypothetical protein